MRVVRICSTFKQIILFVVFPMGIRSFSIYKRTQRTSFKNVVCGSHTHCFTAEKYINHSITLFGRQEHCLLDVRRFFPLCIICYTSMKQNWFCRLLIAIVDPWTYYFNFPRRFSTKRDSIVTSPISEFIDSGISGLAALERSLCPFYR